MKRNPLPLLPVVLCVAALATREASAQTPDYDAAMAEAARLEQAGQPREAARSLDALAVAFPDDHALALRLGWLWFQAHDYTSARRHYTRALALSAGASTDSRLGLAWSLFRLGEYTAAREEFERVVAQSPSDASAREGLGLARAAEPRAVRAWASVWVGGQLYRNHPLRRYSYSVAPSLTLQFNDLVTAGVTYRLVNYDYLARQPGRPPTYWMALQQELHAAVGVARTGYAVRLHFGYAWDANNTALPAYVFGVSSRFTLRGELRAEASGTIFPDYSSARVAGAWDARLSDTWTLGPVLAAQYANGTAGGSIGARVGMRVRSFALSLTGRVGDELRPTWLAESITFATNDHVRAAVSATGRVELGRGYGLMFSYDWLRLNASDGVRTTDADAHFLSAGITGAW